jgi:hypothetical protein
MAASISTRSIQDAIPKVLKSAVVAANTDAVVTITPTASEFVIVWWIIAGYNVSPTATTASLKTTGLLGEAVTTNLDYDLVGTLPFFTPGPMYADLGQEVVITLEAGGGSSIGNVNALYTLNRA